MLNDLFNKVTLHFIPPTYRCVYGVLYVPGRPDIHISLSRTSWKWLLGEFRSCLWLFIAISLISMCVVIARFQQEPNSHSRVPFCTRSRPLYTCRMMVMAANWMDGEGAFCIVWLVYHWVMSVLLWLSVCFMCRGGSFFSMRLNAKSGKL